MIEKDVVEAKFCVYIHYRLDNNLPFYIGKGVKYRPNDKSIRNPYWKNIVNSCGYRVEVYKTNLFEDESFSLEKELIKKFGRVNNKTGILSNMTDGGEGTTGRVVTKEQAIENGKRISQYWKDRGGVSWKGRKMTPEVCKANGDRKRGGTSNKGTKWSEQSKQNVKESRRKRREEGVWKTNKGKTWKQTKVRIQIQVSCTWCNKTGDLGNMKRWHLDNCKFKPND
jgi:hypothetical protein